MSFISPGQMSEGDLTGRDSQVTGVASPAKGPASKYRAVEAKAQDLRPAAFDPAELSESSDDEEYAKELTTNQGRLLYMVSLYSHPADETHPKESWLRQQALMVLIYEAIVEEVIDYDYAPASAIVEGMRKYFNVSQEGKSDVDYLREEGLISGLKLSSKDYQPVTCYQISPAGLVVAAKLPKLDRDIVNKFVYPDGTKNPLRVSWRDGEYFLVTDGGVERTSTVTDCESVSYVSSAYLPACLRTGGRPTLSNAHRARDCAISASNIRDELDEVITLNGVSILVAEYIPFGANNIVALNQNLGSTERVQGGFFTALVDDDAAGTKFEVEPGLTSVNILDYTLTRHINFEADIHLPEPPGIVQVEMFGVSLNATGTALYGMQIEAVMDRIRDNISLDHLSRLLVDVHIDSTTIVDSIISGYQRSLLELVFSGNAASRDKVNLIIADEINPHLTADEYMDHGEYENELKQVLGATRAAFDISERDTLVFGEHGLLVAGPSARMYEGLLCSYLEYNALDLFVRNYFNRMFMISDMQARVRKLISESESDPDSVRHIRATMAEVSKDIIFMEEVLGYMDESLNARSLPPEPVEQSGRALYDRLQIQDFAQELIRRVNDLKKNMQGARHELEILREMGEIVSETKMFRLQESVDANMRNLIGLQEANARASHSLEIMQVVLGGSLAFDILDRITGQWTVLDSAWMSAFNQLIINDAPMLWFVVSLLFWGCLGFGLVRILRYLGYHAAGVVTVRLKIQRKINVEALRKYLSGKVTVGEDRIVDPTTNTVKISWEEKVDPKWNGALPKVTVEYDERNGFLLLLTVMYNRRAAKPGKALSAEELQDFVMSELDEAGVLIKKKVENKSGFMEFN